MSGVSTQAADGASDSAERSPQKSSAPLREFLLETVTLWYWAFFCPSRLQQRIDEWSLPQKKRVVEEQEIVRVGDRLRRKPPQTEVTTSGDKVSLTTIRHRTMRDILLYEINPRFLTQYFLLLLILCLPLLIAIFLVGQPVDYLIFVPLILSSYIVATFSLPFSLQMPLLMVLVYLGEWSSTGQPLLIRIALLVLPPGEDSRTYWIAFLPGVLSGLVGSLLLFVLLLLVWWPGHRVWEKVGRFAGVIGGSIISAVFVYFLSVFALTSVDPRTFLAVISPLLVIPPGLVLYAVLSTKKEISRFEAWLYTLFAVVLGIVPNIGPAFFGVEFISIAVRDITGSATIPYFVLGLFIFILGTSAGSILTLITVTGLILHYFPGRLFDRGKILTLFVLLLVAFVEGPIISASIAFTTAIFLAGLAILPTYMSMIGCWLIGFALGARQIKRWPVAVIIGVFAAGILALLKYDEIGVWSLLIVLVVLTGYYRLIPNYLSLNLIATFWHFNLQRSYQHSTASELLASLPPYPDEVIWFSIFRHTPILVMAFQSDPRATLATYQKMRVSSLYGLKKTARKALPQIVVDQLAEVHEINDLLSVTSPAHPILPLLIPLYYGAQENIGSEETERKSNRTRARDVQATATLLPLLQRQARNIRAALEIGSAALKERGLEKCENDLRTLQGQLPGFDLSEREINRWRPVFERWQGVVRAELDRQHQESEGGDIRNPFLAGRPLPANRRELFKGRTKFADDIVRQLLDRNRPTLILYGPRRCGKSSFLLNLPHLLPDEVLPVYLDLQSGSATTNEGDFCYSLVRQIRRSANSQGFALPEEEYNRFKENPYIALDDWLEKAVGLLKGRRVLLCLDEFELLSDALAKGRVSERLFDELRHLIQHNDTLGFLFAGVQTLEELGPNWSNYFISVRPIEMVYLEPAEAAELLTNPDPQFDLRYDSGIVNEIIQLTSGHPYLIQLIGEAMVAQANLQHTRLITIPILSTALEQALGAGEPYFTNLWQGFTGTTPVEIAAGQAALLAIGNNHPLPPPETAGMTSALRRLNRYHILKRTGDIYEFEVPLVARWVRERAIES